jgi:hypothetical protein
MIPPFQVVSCMDDDNQSTRLVSCKVLRLLLMAKPALFNGKSYYHVIAGNFCGVQFRRPVFKFITVQLLWMCDHVHYILYNHAYLVAWLVDYPGRVDSSKFHAISSLVLYYSK